MVSSRSTHGSASVPLDTLCSEDFEGTKLLLVIRHNTSRLVVQESW